MMVVEEGACGGLLLFMDVVDVDAGGAACVIVLPVDISILVETYPVVAEVNVVGGAARVVRLETFSQRDQRKPYCYSTS